MSIIFWKPNPRGFDSASFEELAKNYGQRSVILAKLMTLASSLDFSIPPFVVAPVAFARELNEQYDDEREQKEVSSYLATNEERKKLYQMLLQEHIADFTEATNATTSSSPIIRGSSSLEGFNNLSFAGVCLTAIPHKNIPLDVHLQAGTAKVLAGSFTPYANYYMSHHGIEPRGRNVGLILMDLVKTPIIHATAYAYPDELRIRYFINPLVGTLYAGGYEMLLKRDGFTSAQLPEHAKEFEKVWRHVANTIWTLHDDFYGAPIPLDVEFLVEESNGKKILQIVQMRPISKPHVKNYLQAQEISGINKELSGNLIIPSSHLYHSVGEVTDGEVVDLREFPSTPNFPKLTQGIFSPVFLISHKGGEGTFEFLRSLPEDLQVAMLLITHPENRQHDHLQYTVYEDQRLNMVIHCNENAVSGISHGDKIVVQSNGNQASIRIKRRNQ